MKKTPNLLKRKRRLLLSYSALPLLLLTNPFSMSSVFAQSINLNEKQSSFESVINKIKIQAGADIFGDQKLIKAARPVSISAKNESINTILKKLSIDQDFDLEYSDKTIIIKPRNRKQSAPSGAPKTQLQEYYLLKGTVTGSNNSPLAGATVMVNEQNGEARQTDIAGNFELKIKGNETLQVSMVGFETVRVNIQDRKTIGIQLKILENTLEGVVVTGYTNVKAENFTGSAKTITRKELEKFNNNNIFSILQSLDPSFKLDENVQAGSNPNALPQINIRGVASVGVSAINAPLVILNGFETTLASLYDIDINRIERISILKDASSTSMYGSRGGNGVIIVETRLPKDGKFTVTYDMRPSVTLVDLSDYNLMNASEKLSYENLAGVYNVRSTDPNWDNMYKEVFSNLYNSRLNAIESGVDTYWLSKPVQSTLSVAHSLRLEGGANQVQYSIDANYNDFKGAMKESGRKRSGAGFNLIYRIPNKFLLNNNASFQYTKEYNSPYGSFQNYTTMNPYERIYDANGNYNIVYNDMDFYSFGSLQFNPLYNASLPFRNFNETSLFSNNTLLDWFINSNFKLTAKGVISKTMTHSELYKSPFHTDFYLITDQEKKGSYSFSDGNGIQYEGNLNLQYTKSIGKNQFGVNLVGELKKQNTKLVSNILTGFADDRLISPALALQYAENSLPVVVSRPVRSIGAMASGFYSYDNKYNLSASYRLDGSSLFGANNRYGSFWSTGISYNVHKEGWFRNRYVTGLRLYGNYGINGSENFSADMVSTAYGYSSGDSYYKQYGAAYLSQGNPSLSWPKLHQLSIGTDVKLFDDLLNFSAAYYNKTTRDMISTITVAPSMGFANSMFYQNLGKVQNKGFEITAVARVHQSPSKNFAVYVNASAVQNRSKLLAISDELRAMNQSSVITDARGNVIQPSNYYEEGRSLSVIRAVPSLGIDPASGREMFIDQDNNITYTWNALNQRVVGNREADLYGNLGSTISYKSLTIQLFLNYSLGGDIFNQTLMDKIENNSPYVNADKRVLEERWQTPGQQALYKSISDQSVTQLSSRFVQNENFLRFSNININYDLPLSFIQKYKLQRARLNFAANDMFRWSTVRMERGISYPYARTYNFGLTVQF